jgi:hypothetical protein
MKYSYTHQISRAWLLHIISEAPSQICETILELLKLMWDKAHMTDSGSTKRYDSFDSQCCPKQNGSIKKTLREFGIFVHRIPMALIPV